MVSVIPEKPRICVSSTARVFGVLAVSSRLGDMAKVLKSMSINRGLNPAKKIDAISDDQFRGEVMTSPWRGRFIFSLRASKVTRFAEDPELTKTECRWPSHLDHAASKA